MKEKDIKYDSEKSIILKSLRYSYNNNLFFVGKFDNELGPNRDDFFVLKTDSSLNFPSVGIEPYSDLIYGNPIITSCYPNPFNSEVKIVFKVINPVILKINIFNSLGREITQLENKKFYPGNYSYSYHPKSNPSGIYFLCFFINEKLSKSIKLNYLK